MPSLTQTARTLVGRRSPALLASVACSVTLLSCGAPAERGQPRAGSARARPAVAHLRAQSGPKVARADEQVRDACRVVTREPPAAAILLSACTRATGELGRLLGDAVPAGVIVQTNDTAVADSVVALQRGRERWAIAVPAGPELFEPLELGNERRISAIGYLAHEVAHRIAYAMLYPNGLETESSGGYGSPLPDWLDEALGLLVEPQIDQRARLSLLFDGELIYALPLRRFLPMPHPALEGAPVGGPMRRVFYAQSLAFAQFIEERAGVAGFRALVEALRSGKKQGEALGGVLGFQEDGAGLEGVWHAWLLARRDALRDVAGGGG